MIASARPARFGRGEQTLMELEITPDRVTLAGLDWDAILAEVRDELGLPARARLRAEPHAPYDSGVAARRGPRKHVRGQIRAAELPVKHEIWKFGSPHTAPPR